MKTFISNVYFSCETLNQISDYMCNYNQGKKTLFLQCESEYVFWYGKQNSLSFRSTDNPMLQLQVWLEISAKWNDRNVSFYQSTMDLFSRSMFRSNVSLKTKISITRKVTKLTNKMLFSSMSNNMIQMCSSGCGHFWTIWTNPRSWAKFNRKILEQSRMNNYQKFWKK